MRMLAESAGKRMGTSMTSGLNGVSTKTRNSCRYVVQASRDGVLYHDGVVGPSDGDINCDAVCRTIMHIRGILNGYDNT